MPLVWSGYYHQGVVAFFVSLLVFYLCYQLARKCDYGLKKLAGLPWRFVLRLPISVWRR